MLHLVLLVALASCYFETAAAGPTTTTVTFFIKHQKELRTELEAVFHAVSNPQSPRYGEHLSFDEVVKYQRPAEADIDTVRTYIRTAGGTEVASAVALDKIVAEFPLPSGSFHADSLPDNLRAAIDMMSHSTLENNIYQRNSSERSSVDGAAPASIDAAATTTNPQQCLADRAVPPCIRKAYGLGNATATSSSNGQAVIVNQGFKLADLKSFCQEYHLSACPTHVSTVGTNTGEAGDEASLDVQYISATGQGVPLTWVYINGHTANPFTNWIVWASNTSSIPWVHSLSVGEPEDEFQSDNGGAQAVIRMNSEMMALGARGISIIFASGDSGYQPAQKYGSSSSYVTSVGGVFNGDLGDEPLQVDYQTTGGFSSLNANPIQPWQEDAVKSWLASKGQRPQSFNSSHRCVPDLSIYDAGFYTVQDGSDTVIGGTSAAAPTFAGMISLLNDARLRAGKSTLGFLNYFLYQNADAFLDITKGNNHGYDATIGYDPASGLGTFAVDTFTKLLAKATGDKKESGSSPPDPPLYLYQCRQSIRHKCSHLPSNYTISY